MQIDMGLKEEVPMIIVSGADDRFAMPLAVTFYSALANLERGRAVSLYIIDGGISEENRRRLTEALNVEHVEARLEWVKPDLSPLNGLKTSQWHSQPAYFRLLIPELMPEQFDRVIYLDSDLVVEGNLGDLWEEEIGDFPALAVQDYLIPYVSCLKALPLYQLLGLSPDTPYCNTGVMVMNLKRWRAEEISHRVLEYIRKFNQFVRYADQDGINAIIAGAWGLLDPKWNVMLGVLGSYGQLSNMSEVERQHAQEELLRAPFILHFTNPIKPWHFIYRGLAQSRFFYYLKKSGWFGFIGDMRSIMNETWEEQNKYDKWMERLYMAKQELDALIPPRDSFILVDDIQWGTEILEDWHAIPFLERDGQYWGPPPNDEIAIQEFERLRRSGASFIVFGWPAFWWLDYYSGLNRHLRSAFHCVLHNDRLVVFDLRS